MLKVYCHQPQKPRKERFKFLLSVPAAGDVLVRALKRRIAQVRCLPVLVYCCCSGVVVQGLCCVLFSLPLPCDGSPSAPHFLFLLLPFCCGFTRLSSCDVAVWLVFVLLLFSSLFRPCSADE